MNRHNLRLAITIHARDSPNGLIGLLVALLVEEALKLESDHA